MSDALGAAAAAYASCRLRRRLLIRSPTIWRPVRSLRRLDCKSSSFSLPSIGIGLRRGAASFASGSAAGGTTSWSASDVSRFPDGGEPPTSVGLDPIVSEEQFDRIIAEAHQLEEPIVVLWTASWCRKCIFLKPKLEKLAADYYPRVRFFCIDVNAVPHRLVKRAGVTKMPTVQLWRDSKIQAELVAGYKAWMVIDDVRKMIENED